MKHMLLAKGLWGHVDGSETIGEDATPGQREPIFKETLGISLKMTIGTSRLTSCEKAIPCVIILSVIHWPTSYSSKNWERVRSKVT